MYKHILFSGNDAQDLLADLILGQRSKAKARAARLQRWHDLADIVADQAEARVFCILLHNYRRE